MDKGTRVLVAGGTGTIGIPLVRRLIKSGADVTVASLDAETYARKILGEKVRFIREDLRQSDACRRVTEGQECVFNLVGIKGSVGIGVTKAASYFVSMLNFQTHLMEAAYRAKVRRYLFVSSICAYPRSAVPHEEETVWNGMPLQNDRFAGIAKRVGELQAEAYLQEYGWDAVRIIRPSNVYGPFDDFNPATAQVIPSLLRRMLDAENPVQVWGDGTAVRDFIFSEDVVEAALLAMEKAPPNVPINIGGGAGISIKQLAETIAQVVSKRLGFLPELKWDPSKPAGDPVRILATQRSKQWLNFKPKTSLADGIRETMEWYLANKELANERQGVLKHDE